MKKKSNNNNALVAAIIMVVVIGGIAAYAMNRNGDDEMMNDNMMGVSSNMMQSDLVNKSSTEYKDYMGYKSEEYDRYFIANMIAHHQGAVEMAKLALTNAKHEDIKTLASTIISAQTSEITNMTAWQKDWGYPASSGEMMMDHSSTGMMETNAVMMNDLNGKTGEAFDKAFLEQMIMHHQSAINMAAPGKTNAKHQEVRDLTAAIITAQTKEIQQMKQWQKDWGYKN